MMLLRSHRRIAAFSLVEPKQSGVPEKAGIHLQRGFSLVELSIVLVILGLLVGGVLAGQSLIRAAELRSVSAEYSRFTAATYAFRDKYFALPGDLRDATRFWGRAANTADCVTNSSAAVTSAAAGACDGDGDGAVSMPPTVSTVGEMHQFWKQLALAGLIEGSYTGIAGPFTPNAGQDVIVGTNAPRGRMSNSGWGMASFNFPGDPWTYANNFGNMFTFGGQNPGTFPIAPILKPEEAWNIDTKIDDGRPGQGTIWVRSGGNAWGTSGSCTTSTSFSDYAGQYRLSNTAPACSIFTNRVL